MDSMVFPLPGPPQIHRRLGSLSSQHLKASSFLTHPHVPAFPVDVALAVDDGICEESSLEAGFVRLFVWGFVCIFRSWISIVGSRRRVVIYTDNCARRRSALAQGR